MLKKGTLSRMYHDGQLRVETELLLTLEQADGQSVASWFHKRKVHGSSDMSLDRA